MRRTWAGLLILAGCHGIPPDPAPSPEAEGGVHGSPAPGFAFDPDREEGVHGGVEVEWWYHYGFLTDDSGGEWAVFSSFFRAERKGVPLSRYLLYDLLDL
ncbi:MAG TPA: hypothetical protein VEN81_03950, partial [Planctomycetota bacterium]|nr:hypothetical protein [Planctomycetota bacterium]